MTFFRYLLIGVALAIGAMLGLAVWNWLVGIV